MSGQPFTPKSHWMKTREYTPEPFKTLGAKAIVGYMHWEDRLYDGEKIA